jgi:hypothetical protein
MGAATLTQAGPEGISAELQERVRAFTAFYEANAYLAYNLALRVACADACARRAVHVGFLRQLDDRPAGLAASTAEAAVREAAPTADAAAAGDPASQTLLGAMGSLAPTERAAVSLADLADGDAELVGAALGLPAEQAGALLERARASFAAALGCDADTAEATRRDWMWAAPPDEIWQDLYPEFHRAVERRLRAGVGAAPTLIVRPDAPVAPAKARRRASKGKPRRPIRWGLALPLLALVAVIAAGGATRQLQGSSGANGPLGKSGNAEASAPGDPAPTEPATGENGDAKPHKPLTAALLDKLRLRELRQLSAYGRQQADQSLPARQRRAASRRIAALERAARARLRAQQRQVAAQRDREAAARARSNAPPPPPPTLAPRPTTPTRPHAQAPPRQTTTPGAPPQNRQQADRSCLRDEETGQYICPQ